MPTCWIRSSRDCAGPRCEILGIPVDLIDYDAAFAAIQDWRASGSRRFVVVESASDIQLSRDPAVRTAVRAAGLNLPDGVGVVTAARLLGHKTRGRVAGPDLMLKICEWGRAQVYRHFLYGSTVDVVERLRARLVCRYPGLDIAGFSCPPFRALTAEEDEEVVGQINACAPDVVWVGLGGAKQIQWMADHLGRVQAPVMIGVGAAFNFHAGVVRRAPSWVRRWGMEWAYRMATEPRKILPRTRHTLLFGIRVAAQAAVWRLAGARPSRQA